MPAPRRTPSAARLPWRPKLKILIIRLSALGDVVRTLPALDCLRRAWPESRLDWLVEPASFGLLAGHPQLDGVLLFPRPSLKKALLHPGTAGTARRELALFLEAIRSPRYDLVIDFQGTLKTGMISMMTRAPRRAGLGRGHAREMAHLFYNEPAPIPRGKMNRVDRALALVASLGVDVSSARGILPERPEDAAVAEAFLSEQGLERPIVLFPGASRVQAYKRYPAAAFAAAADRIARKTGAPVVIAWGPGEESLAARVRASMQAPAVIAPPLDIGQLGALIRRAALFLSGDTGPMHMAWMAGTPVVAIFGPTDIAVNRPGGARGAVASQGIYCAPCRNRGCVARTCLESLPPEAVAATALDLLARTGATT